MKRTIAQTPAPKKERIYGSDINKPKSAESKKTAEKISFGESIIASIKTLLDKHNSKFTNKKIPLSIGKAVVRRGMGAYSSSHRPTIKEGKPNSRTAWGLARLNAFIFKIQKGKSKSGKYTQDNDLIKELGYKVSKMETGGNVGELNIIIKNIDPSKKYTGTYKKIFDIIEEDITLYNPYGTSYEEIKGKDFHITITPLPEQFIIEKISKLKNIEIISKMKNGGEVLLAPNGKPSNLNPEQYKLVRTPEFKKWFGDWEENAKIQYGGFGYLNGYKTGKSSLAIDENGEPKVFYHQTSIDNYKGLINSGIINFELEYGGGKSDKLLPFGFYLKPSSEDIFKEKKDYAQVPFFLNLRSIETFENRKDITEHYERISRFSKFIKSKKLKFTDKTKITDYFKSREIDCVRIIKDFDSWEVNFTETFLVLDKNNIKLADGTNTTFDANNPDIRYAGGGEILTAPNGKPSKLTPEQYRIVRTPQFKAWFGDWEKAYETENYDNVSKVIDEQTKEPLVVYHGGDVGFDVFDVNKTTNKRFHFTTDREYAKFRGGISKAYFLKIYNLTYENWSDRRTLPKPKGKFVGFGNLLNDIKNLKEVIAFEPNQIKLADGTNTTFNNNNPDIRYSGGGNLDLIYGEIYSGKQVRDIVSKYGSQQGTDMIDFATENIKIKDKYILDFVKVRLLIDNDINLHTFISEEYEPGNKVNYQEITEPILLGYDKWDNTPNVVLDGYHRVLQALYNNQEEILAFINLKTAEKIRYFKKGGNVNSWKYEIGGL